MPTYEDIMHEQDLLLRCILLSSHLFCLQVLVEKVKSGLVSLGSTHDSEHPLLGIIVGCLVRLAYVSNDSLVRVP
jgi:hypothetical protein